MLHTSLSWHGKWALVTGASSGIGAAFARRLAAEGAHVMLVARRADRLQALADALTAQYGIQTATLAIDLSEPNAPQTLYEQVKATGHPVSILVNNAGLGVYGRLHEADPARLRQLVRVNVDAVADLTRLFLPGMVQANDGSIFNIASTVAFQPTPYMAEYGASKAFVLSLTEALWAEYRGTGVRILAVCPGGTETEFFDAMQTKRPEMPIDTPETVVDNAFRAITRGRSTVICGHWSNFATAQLPRLAPRQVAAWLSGQVMRRVLEPKGKV